MEKTPSASQATAPLQSSPSGPTPASKPREMLLPLSAAPTPLPRLSPPGPLRESSWTLKEDASRFLRVEICSSATSDGRTWEATDASSPTSTVRLVLRPSCTPPRTSTLRAFPRSLLPGVTSPVAHLVDHPTRSFPSYSNIVSTPRPPFSTRPSGPCYHTPFFSVSIFVYEYK